VGLILSFVTKLIVQAVLYFTTAFFELVSEGNHKIFGLYNALSVLAMEGQDMPTQTFQHNKSTSPFAFRILSYEIRLKRWKQMTDKMLTAKVRRMEDAG
jgi:hypothetical protein